MIDISLKELDPNQECELMSSQSVSLSRSRWPVLSPPQSLSPSRKLIGDASSSVDSGVENAVAK